MAIEKVAMAAKAAAGASSISKIGGFVASPAVTNLLTAGTAVAAFSAARKQSAGEVQQHRGKK